MEFKKFVILSENTIAQSLKKFDKRMVKGFKFMIDDYLQKNLQDDDNNAGMAKLGKWLTFRFIDERIDLSNTSGDGGYEPLFKWYRRRVITHAIKKSWMVLDDRYSSYSMNLPEPARIKTFLDDGNDDQKTYEMAWDAWNDTRFPIDIGALELANFFRTALDRNVDYIVEKLGDREFLSKLNNPDFTVDKLEEENDIWHDTLARQDVDKNQGRKGRLILNSGDLHWVSLDRVSCEMEGAAGGHCGNSGGKPQDNILSLRTTDNKVMATFIVRGGALVEAKGRFNKPPAQEFHPAIADLLSKTDLISSINFNSSYQDADRGISDWHLSHMNKALIRSVIASKPNIDATEHQIRNKLRIACGASVGDRSKTDWSGAFTAAEYQGMEMEKNSLLQAARDVGLNLSSVFQAVETLTDTYTKPLSFDTDFKINRATAQTHTSPLSGGNMLDERKRRMRKMMEGWMDRIKQVEWLWEDY